MLRFAVMNYDLLLDKLIKDALQEDIGDGDHTTLSCIPPDAKGKAALKIKESGILAGVDIAKKIFTMFDVFTRRR